MVAISGYPGILQSYPDFNLSDEAQQTERNLHFDISQFYPDFSVETQLKEGMSDSDKQEVTQILEKMDPANREIFVPLVLHLYPNSQYQYARLEFLRKFVEQIPEKDREAVVKFLQQLSQGVPEFTRRELIGSLRKDLLDCITAFTQFPFPKELSIKDRCDLFHSFCQVRVSPEILVSQLQILYSPKMSKSQMIYMIDLLRSMSQNSMVFVIRQAQRLFTDDMVGEKVGLVGMLQSLDPSQIDSLISRSLILQEKYQEKIEVIVSLFSAVKDFNRDLVFDVLTKSAGPKTNLKDAIEFIKTLIQKHGNDERIPA